MIQQQEYQEEQVLGRYPLVVKLLHRTVPMLWDNREAKKRLMWQVMQHPAVDPWPS